ncbi:MAG: PDZ domain-containing protein [Myxococcota bacterium]
MTAITKKLAKTIVQTPVVAFKGSSQRTARQVPQEDIAQAPTLSKELLKSKPTAAIPQGVAAPESSSKPPIGRLVPRDWHSEVAAYIARLAGDKHLKPQPLDDTLSQKIYDKLDTFVAFAVVNTQAEMQNILGLRHQLDEMLRDGNLDRIFSLLGWHHKRWHVYSVTRIKELERLFTNDPTLSPAQDTTPLPLSYPASTIENMQSQWRQQVSLDVEELRAQGMTPKAIYARLMNLYHNEAYFAVNFDATDAFDTLIDAYLGALDPHSSYYPPRHAQEFAATLTQSIVGLGTELRHIFKANEAGEFERLTVIGNVTEGGPADNSLLKSGDVILEIGENPQHMRDIRRVHHDDVLNLLRGAENSVVFLRIKPEKDFDTAPHVWWRSNADASSPKAGLLGNRRD